MKPSVLITGASSGIGAATAAALLGDGWRVFGTSRKPAQAAAARPELEWIELDVCDDASVERGVARVLEEVGSLDAVVCNAGTGIFGSVEETPLELARQQFETNFFGVLRTLRAMIPSMRRAGRGRIVLVGSLAGRAPIPFQAHYSATKAAVDALALSLRNELHGSGVHVSLIEPGDIDTGFNDVMAWGDPAASAYGERVRNAERVIRESLPKAPGPEVVAQTIRRALRARRPRVRYPVGPDSKLVPIARRLLPDWISLAFIRSHFRI
jgi:NAD(P)-dependent dehydrogenase (short-subunit alcohol dehydrogenase family)